MQFLTKSSLSVVVFLLLIQMQVFGQGAMELPRTYLATTTDNVVFDMSMSYKDYYGSGLLVLKRESAANYHGVFLSKVGLKLMEFKIVEGEFKWIKLLEYIDKKATRKLLERDFSMLMLSDFDKVKKIKSLKLKNGLERYKVWNSNKLVVGVKEEKVKKVENRKAINFTKTMITYQYGEKNTPKSVSLTHRTIKVKFQLELLEQ